VGFGVIGEIATGFPGYDSIIPKDSATIGEILKENGYATSWFGKNHNTPTYGRPNNGCNGNHRSIVKAWQVKTTASLRSMRPWASTEYIVNSNANLTGGGRKFRKMTGIPTYHLMVN